MTTNCEKQTVKSGQVAVLGDSWAIGPATGQPNLGDGLTSIGIPNVVFNIGTFSTCHPLGPGGTNTCDVLTFLNNYIASGGTGAGYSLAMISVGAHDMIDFPPLSPVNGTIPVAQSVANLVGIGAACATLGLRCVVIGMPTMFQEPNPAGQPDQHVLGIASGPGIDTRYTQAGAQCPNLQIISGVVNQILIGMPDWAYTQGLTFPNYNPPDYENVSYSQTIPHPNAAGFNYLAQIVWAIHNQLP